MKKIIFSLVGLVLILFAVSAVFGEEDPDLSPFDASVGLANAPPVFIELAPVSDKNPDGSSRGADGDGEVLPIAAGQVYVEVVFAVEDGNGLSDLLDAPSVLADFDTPTATDSEIGVRVTSPANGIMCGSTCRQRDTEPSTYPSSVAAACSGTTCEGGAAPCTDTSASTTQKVYTCYLQMEYFDEPTFNTPGDSAADMWTISIYFEDDGGNAITATSGDFDTASWATDILNYVHNGVASEIGILAADSVAWASVDVTLTDTPGDDGNGGDVGTGLTLENLGNQIVTSVDLTSNDLTGDTTPTAILEAESMSIGVATGVQSTDVGACDVPGGGGAGTDGTALDPETQLTTYTGGLPEIIDFTAQGPATDNNDLYFCIWAQLNTASCEGADCLSGSGSDIAFSANDDCSGGPTTACDAPGEQWEMTGNT